MSVGEFQEARSMVLHDISWETYKRLREEVSEGIRLTYNRGVLEIMSPSRRHEHIKRTLGRMIEALTEVLNIPISSGGSTTHENEVVEQGLEPDECYYVAQEPKMRGKDTLDLSMDPPPDLVVEVDVANRSLARLPLYANLRVPEVWRHDKDGLHVLHLQADGTYVEQDHSASFPFLPLEVFREFLARRNESDETTWIRSFRAWAATLK
jgi:Uma2 family endonuclease